MGRPLGGVNGSKNSDLANVEAVLEKISGKASPGDIANLCLAMIQASPQPWHAAQRLLWELPRIEKPQRMPTTASGMSVSRLLKILDDEE